MRLLPSWLIGNKYLYMYLHFDMVFSLFHFSSLLLNYSFQNHLQNKSAPVGSRHVFEENKLSMISASVRGRTLAKSRARVDTRKQRWRPTDNQLLKEGYGRLIRPLLVKKRKIYSKVTNN